MRNERFNRIRIWLIGIAICLWPALFVPETFAQNKTLQPGIGTTYFSRTIRWDEDAHTSKVKSFLFTASAGYEISEGFSLSILLGYSLSNFDSLVFRKLPLSVELNTGQQGGFVFGGEIQKSVFSSGNFEIGAQGQFVYYSGRHTEWEIPGLAVQGTVTGKPSWMNVTAGPCLAYRGYNNFTPYVYISYDKLWGTYKMDQSIQNLTGKEDKKIEAKSVFGTSIGANYGLSETFHLKGEVRLMPYSNGVDWGFRIGAFFTF